MQVRALTVHCRTRVMGHEGELSWSWISKVKESLEYWLYVTAMCLLPKMQRERFDETNADGVMIAHRGIGNPWIFKERIKGLIEQWLYFNFI